MIHAYTATEQKQIPVPDSATVLMSTPCSLAMKPSTEKMANPAYKLVQLLMQEITIQSLYTNNTTTICISVIYTK